MTEVDDVPAGVTLACTDAETCSCYEILHSTPKRDPSQELGCEHRNCPYRYLRRNAFTSEAFKIQLKNLHRFTGFKELKKQLKTLQVKYRKLKLLRDVSFITFESAEERDHALKVLDGYVWRGRKVEAKIALGRADPLLQKRLPSNATDTDSIECKRVCLDQSADRTEEVDEDSRLRDTVTPLWRMAYEPDQLNMKRASLLSNLVAIRSKVLSCNPGLKSKLVNTEKSEQFQDPPVCPLVEIISSPITTNYRNKSELTIGCNLEGKGPLIGFRFSKYRDGSTAVGSYHHLNILPSATVNILDSLQQFITLYSPDNTDMRLTPYDPITHEGHWRQVLVRETRLNDRLLLVDLHPQTMGKEQLDHLSGALCAWFCSGGPGESVQLTSLYISTRKTTSEKFDSTNTQLLHGKDHIVELCCNLKFRISLDAFFQVNTLATEVLYRQVMELAIGGDGSSDSHGEENKEKGRLLLDVCCGTGTIGLCLAKYFDRIIGIEMVPSAVEDAKHNMELNSITNAQFYVGKAEDTIHDAINSIPEDFDITVVVDPPRAGLHTAVIQALRRCSRIQRIVFVSCSLESAAHNFIEFSRPTSNRFQGIPFIPMLSKAVDLFPQTRHVEALILLQRISQVNK